MPRGSTGERRLLSLVALAASFLATASAGAATLEWIGQGFAGPAVGQGNFFALSSDGSVATFNDGGRAYRWTRSGGAQQLGTGTGGAHAVSADGNVVVGRWVSGNDIGNVWTPEGEQFLGLYNPTGVSADGNVIAGYAGDLTGWVKSPLGLVALPGFFSDGYSLPQAVSGDGLTIVGYNNSSSGQGVEVWRYHRDWDGGPGTPEDAGLGYDVQYLGSGVPGAVTEQCAAIATAVSYDGSIVVGGDIQGWCGAWSWTTSTGFVRLAPFDVTPGTSTGSIAKSVNADGSRIVGVGFSQPGALEADSAFLWDAVHGMRRLSDVLRNEYRLPLASVELTTAMAISADGKVILGVGKPTPSDGYQVYIATLTPPEPVPAAPRNYLALLAALLGTAGLFACAREPIAARRILERR